MTAAALAVEIMTSVLQHPMRYGLLLVLLLLLLLLFCDISYQFVCVRVA